MAGTRGTRSLRSCSAMSTQFSTARASSREYPAFTTQSELALRGEPSRNDPFPNARMSHPLPSDVRRFGVVGRRSGVPRAPGNPLGLFDERQQRQGKIAIRASIESDAFVLLQLRLEITAKPLP